MVEPYGAIFGQPKPGSPAAQTGIEAGDVITAINGAPLARSRDFATIIPKRAAGLCDLSHHISQWRVDANQADARILQLQAPFWASEQKNLNHLGSSSAPVRVLARNQITSA
jgi:hypothetical protein